MLAIHLLVQALKNKRLDKSEKVENAISQAKEKIKKLQRDNLKLMEQKDQAWSDVGTFQNALEQKNKEK